MPLTKAQPKGEKREAKRTALLRKQVKHGIGKWTPKPGISKAWKKMIEKKITIKRKIKGD